MTVPITLSDVAGTPLGMDRPGSSRIQAVSLVLRWSPAAAVTSATLKRAGAAQSLTPLYETTASGSGYVSWAGSFDGATNPLTLTQPPGQNGDAVFSLNLILSSSLAPGSTVSLVLDPEETLLSNQAGTLGEFVDERTLILRGGSITVQPSISGQDIPLASKGVLVTLAVALGISGFLLVRRL